MQKKRSSQKRKGEEDIDGENAKRAKEEKEESIESSFILGYVVLCFCR